MTLGTPNFRGLTVASSGGLLRVLISECESCAAFDPSNTPASRQPKYRQFKAIWDTGATHSVITQPVVDACKLKPTGIMQVHGVTGSERAETFLVNLRLPNDVQFYNWTVTLGRLTPNAAILLGMDVITHGDFAITNVGGNTVFTFRIPSIKAIDYAAEANTLNAEAQKRAKRKQRRASEKRPSKWDRKR